VRHVGQGITRHFVSIFSLIYHKNTPIFAKKKTSMTEPILGIKVPALNANSFTANGTKYIVYGEDMSVGVFEVFDRMQIEMKSAMSIEALYKSLNDIWKDLEAQKTASAAVKTYDLLSGAQKLANDEKHPALLLCTMFIMPENHDRRAWDKALATEWINDWIMEGLSIGFFIQSGRLFAATFTGDSPGAFPDSLETEA